MSNTGPMPDRPTSCDWCKIPISPDDWMECDEWHLCGDCYRVLMDGTNEEFKARHKK